MVPGTLFFTRTPKWSKTQFSKYPYANSCFSFFTVMILCICSIISLGRLTASSLLNDSIMSRSAVEAIVHFSVMGSRTLLTNSKYSCHCPFRKFLDTQIALKFGNLLAPKMKLLVGEQSHILLMPSLSTFKISPSTFFVMRKATSPADISKSPSSVNFML